MHGVMCVADATATATVVVVLVVVGGGGESDEIDVCVRERQTRSDQLVNTQCGWYSFVVLLKGG